MEVRVSGAILSSLFLQVANSRGDVEGFLLGEISSRTVSAITDSHSQDVKHERTANIQGFIPCQSVFSFYNSVGRIDEKEITELLSKKKEVIGWYKFRRNCPTQVSMREQVVHRNLINTLEFSPTKEFLFAVISASLSSAMSTHTFVHSIHCCDDNSIFVRVPVNIINLGDTSHSEYRLSSRNAPVKSKVYQSVIDSYRHDFIDDDRCIQQVTGIHSMYLTTLKKLQELAEDVKRSESDVSTLRSEVVTVRARLEKRRHDIRQATVAKSSGGTSAVNAARTANPGKELGDMDTEENSPAEPKLVKEQATSTSTRRGDEEATADGRNVNGTCETIAEEPMDTGLEDKPFEQESYKTHHKLQAKISSRSRRKQETPRRTDNVRKMSHGDTGSDDDETQDYSLPEDMEQDLTQSLSQIY